IYSPPASGNMADNSAYVRAPASESIPDVIQTAITVQPEPTLQVMTRAFRKTPVPITVPTTTAIAPQRLNPRMSFDSMIITLSDSRTFSIGLFVSRSFYDEIPDRRAHG